MKELTIILLCCLLLTGCAYFIQGPTGTSTNTTTSSATPSSSTTPTSYNEEVPPIDIYLQLYAPDEALDDFIIHEALSSYPLDPNQIMDWLREITDYYEGVVVNSAIVEDRNTLRLDVNDAFYQELITMGTTGEKMIVGCLVNTFLSAYGVDQIILTADGEVIESGHVIYDFPLTKFN